VEIITSNRINVSFTIALAVCMAFVYPAHLIIDHSDLFDHDSHTHHHESHEHPDDHPHADDELCALCLSLSSIEISESVELVNVIVKVPFFDIVIFTGASKSVNLSDARAPPANLLI